MKILKVQNLEEVADNSGKCLQLSGKFNSPGQFHLKRNKAFFPIQKFFHTPLGKGLIFKAWLLIILLNKTQLLWNKSPPQKIKTLSSLCSIRNGFHWDDKFEGECRKYAKAQKISTEQSSMGMKLMSRRGPVSCCWHWLRFWHENRVLFKWRNCSRGYKKEPKNTDVGGHPVLNSGKHKFILWTLRTTLDRWAHIYYK